MEKKKIIAIVSILIVIILVVCLCKIFISDKDNVRQQTFNNQTEQEDNRVIENGITKLDITQNIGGLEFSNVEIEMKTDRECELTAEVLNTSNEMIEAHTIRIRVSDGNGELNEVFAGNISSIPAGEKRILSSTIRKNLTSATNVTFEIIE